MWNELSIFKKGLVLISVPLLFQLAFFALLADMERSNAQAVSWSLHSKEVLRQTQVVLRNLLELGTGMRGFILSADPDLKVAYDRAARQLPQDVIELQGNVSDSPGQTVKVRQLARSIKEFMAWHAETMRLSAAGKRDEAIARAKHETSTRLQDGIVQAMMAFIRTEDELDQTRTRDLERSQTRQQWLLGVGAPVTFLITLGLVFGFARNIGRRLRSVAVNARRFAEGKELAPQLGGSDEVARLDESFRRMAEQITSSNELERRSAEAMRELYEQSKRAAEEIRRLNQELEQRIDQRTAELARANESLRQADRAKDDFLAMLGHELRNPLAPLRNGLQILKTPGISPAAAAQARAIMDRQVQHMVRLVDDLLDIARIMRGKIELRRERLDVAMILHRAAETAQPAIDMQGQELVISCPPQAIYVEADLVRIAQVVSNLLVNAAKYSERAGKIWLSGAREDDAAVIRVRDSGMGISGELLPRIFDLFVQADDSPARSQGGLGIGLTLVRRLVEMHAGAVTATSPGVGQGSEFVVRLPALSGQAPTQLARAAAPERATPRRRVLVVDDNVDAAESTAMLLQFEGHQVEIAHDGRTAVEKAGTFRPDVVLLDIGLPGMNGYEVARTLRQSPEHKGLVLAAVTGYGQDEDRRRSTEAGFDCHLTKPLAPGVLTAFVASSRTAP